MRKKRKFLRIIKDVALGIVAPALGLPTGVIGGVVAGVGAAVKNEKDRNLTSEGGGINKINYSRIAGYLIFIGLTLFLIFGKIDKEMFEYILKMFRKVD